MKNRNCAQLWLDETLALMKLPKKYITPELCLAAVQSNCRALQYVPRALKTPELCRMAVQNDSLTLQYVPEGLKTPELCFVAVQSDREAFAYVPNGPAEIYSLAFSQGTEAKFLAVLQRNEETFAAFGYGAHDMLLVCAASPRGEQLLRSAPVLLWLIAPILLREGRNEPDIVHKLLGMRQRDLLALVCGRGNSALLRLLTKVPPPTADADRRILTAVLKREEASSLLRHKQHVPWPLLNLIAHQGDRIKIPLVRSIIMSDMDVPAMRNALGNLDAMIRDTTNLGRQLDIADAPGLVAACTDWRKLNGLHDAWTERLNNLELDYMVKKYGDELPPPPFPGTDVIQPICTVRELLLEGKIMHHCVGSYVNDVKSGQSYFYRITEPERATLEIHRDYIMDTLWSQGQLKTYYNGRPGDDTVKLVMEWCEDDGILNYALVLRRLERAKRAGSEEDLAGLWDENADFLLALGREEEALAAREEAAALQPKNSRYLFSLGCDLYNRNRPAEALVALDRAISVATVSEVYLGDIWNIKGDTLNLLGRREEALAAYERATELEPENAFYWRAKGSVLVKLDRRAEALAAYKRAIYAEPMLLKCLPESFKTPELCLAAVQGDRQALQYVPEALRTPELYEIAFR